MRGTRLAFLAFTLTGPGVLAHHSSVVHYDQDAELTHENVTILDWRFSNPHARLVFVAPDQRSGEPVEWTAQSTNVNRLARFGYSIDTFVNAKQKCPLSPILKCPLWPACAIHLWRYRIGLGRRERSDRSPRPMRTGFIPRRLRPRPASTTAAKDGPGPACRSGAIAVPP